MKNKYVLFLLSLCLTLALAMSAYAQKRMTAPSKPIVVVTEPKPISVQSQPKTQGKQKFLTNADVIRMVKAGFGEGVIINAVQTNETLFDLSLDGLFELKNAGVSQKVIEAMQNLSTGKKQQVQSAVVSTQSSGTDRDKSPPTQNPQFPEKAVVSENNDTSKNTISTDVPEVSISADMDRVRTVLIKRFTGQGFNIDKDQPSQLIFIKEVGGVKGFMTGLFLGRNQNNPRQILTFILTKSGNNISVLAKLAIVYPDDTGLGNAHDFDNKKVRKSLVKELIEIKKEAEK